jgi:hypothetical protein
MANQKISKDYGVGILLYPLEIHTIAVIGLNPGINCMKLSKRWELQGEQLLKM